MAAAYVVEKSPLIIKILDMIPKLIETKNKFDKDDPRYKEIDETIDKLIAKLSGIFVSPETSHFPVMYEETALPGQEGDDMPDTYIPTENSAFDTSVHLRAAVSGSLNETPETVVVEETPEQRQAREAQEEKEQREADELAERWNNAGGRKSRNQKKSKRKSKRRRRMSIF
jgi:hypothetical protein